MSLRVRWSLSGQLVKYRAWRAVCLCLNFAETPFCMCIISSFHSRKYEHRNLRKWNESPPKTLSSREPQKLISLKKKDLVLVKIWVWFWPKSRWNFSKVTFAFLLSIGGAVFGIDVFRFDPLTGLIIEHWDDLQSKPANPNPSGHTVLDGPTVAVDLDKTAANKAICLVYTQMVLIGGNKSAQAQFFNGNNLIQHNANWADGLDGMAAGLAAMAAAGSAQVYLQLHQVHGEGNFVLVMSDGLLGTQPTGIYDIYRLDGGKIVEHWDVFTPITPPNQWGAPNGKFSALTI